MRGLFIHADVLAGMDNVDGQAFIAELFAQQRAQQFLASNQVDADGQLTRGLNRSADLRFRGLVGSHGIDSDVSQHVEAAAKV